MSGIETGLPDFRRSAPGKLLRTFLKIGGITGLLVGITLMPIGVEYTNLDMLLHECSAAQQCHLTAVRAASDATSGTLIEGIGIA